MTQLELLERLLDLIDEASGLIRELPDEDKLRDHSPTLEGNSNGGFIYFGLPDDYYYLRDQVNLRILKEKGELPAELDPSTI